MRVRDGNSGNAAPLADRLNRVVVAEANRLPEEIADWRLNEVTLLTDGKRRACIDRDQARLDLG